MLRTIPELLDGRDPPKFEYSPELEYLLSLGFPNEQENHSLSRKFWALMKGAMEMIVSIISQTATVFASENSKYHRVLNILFAVAVGIVGTIMIFDPTMIGLSSTTLFTLSPPFKISAEVSGSFPWNAAIKQSFRTFSTLTTVAELLYKPHTRVSLKVHLNTEYKHYSFDPSGSTHQSSSGNS